MNGFDEAQQYSASILSKYGGISGILEFLVEMEQIELQIIREYAREVEASRGTGVPKETPDPAAVDMPTVRDEDRRA